MRKPGKKDYSDVKSYCPIALLNTISKVLESVLATHISYLVKLHHSLPFTYTGDQKSSLAEHAIYHLVENAYPAWNKGNVDLALFLDVTGAFDNVSHKRLLQNLCKWGIHKSVVKCIKSFLTHCSTTLKTSKYTTEKLAISTEIPQGSPLSPILYLFYNADLIDECIQLDPNIKASGFIDDVILLAIGKSLEATCGLLFSAHQVCLKWAKTHGSKFALKEYQLVYLTHRQKDNCKRKLDLGEIGIIKGA